MESRRKRLVLKKLHSKFPVKSAVPGDFSRHTKSKNIAYSDKSIATITQC